jgi:hypothetical protein
MNTPLCLSYPFQSGKEEGVEGSENKHRKSNLIAMHSEHVPLSLDALNIPAD